MFEYGQDIALLHGAVLSATKTLNGDDSIFDISDLSDEKLWQAARIVSSSIDKILNMDISQMVDDKKVLLDKVTKTQRIHAVILYATLRSSGIMSNAADEFYESTVDIFPDFNWKFYAHLNVFCHWSCYFVECVTQLPDNMFVLSLKNILQVSSNNIHFKYYSLHTVTEAFLQKFFVSKELLISINENYPFNFIYEKPKKYNEVEQNETDLNDSAQMDNEVLSVVYKYIYWCLSSEISVEKADINLAKIFIHSIVTLLKLIHLTKISGTITCSIMKELEDLVLLAEKYLLSKLCIFSIKTVMADFKSDQLHSLGHSIVSWGAPESYLLFLIFYYWKGILAKFKNSEPWIESINRVTVELYFLIPFHHPTNITGFKEHIKMLQTVVQFKLPGSQYALHIILQNIKFIDLDEDFFSCVEKQHSEDISDDSYISLLDSVMEITSSNKSKLVKLFVDLYSKLCDSRQNRLLCHLFKYYGMDATFKLQDFHQQLSVFMNVTVTIDQAKQLIGPLCLQSAEEIISHIVGQAVRNGAQSTVLLEALKFVPAVCTFWSPENNTELLVHVLQHYFTKIDLSPVESQNIELVIKVLFEVHGECCIISFDEFMEKCILPNLNLNKSANLFLSLDVLNVSIELLKDKCFLQLQPKNETLLVASLIQMIHSCVVMCNGKLKEMVINTLNSVIQLRNKECVDDGMFQKWLSSILSKMNPLTRFYATEFMQTEIEVSSLSASQLWALCCITKTELLPILSEKILNNADPLGYLITAITPLLLHFTSAEWVQSSLLIEHCLELPTFNMMHVFPEYSVWKLSANTQVQCGTTRFFTGCLILLKSGTPHPDQNLDWVYLINCYTNVIKNALKRDKALNHLTLISTFLEVCLLASKFNADEIFVFRVILLDILREAQLISDDHIQKVTLQFFIASVKHLPDCSEVSSLLEQLK